MALSLKRISIILQASPARWFLCLVVEGSNHPYFERLVKIWDRMHNKSMAVAMQISDNNLAFLGRGRVKISPLK